jgi:hypothetical protein
VCLLLWEGLKNQIPPGIRTMKGDTAMTSRVEAFKARHRVETSWTDIRMVSVYTSTIPSGTVTQIIGVDRDGAVYVYDEGRDGWSRLGMKELKK